MVVKVCSRRSTEESSTSGGISMRPKPSVIFLVAVLIFTVVAAETLSARGRRERKPSPPPRPTTTVATTLVAAAPVVAVADGPLPVGDVVAVGLVTAAVVITVSESRGPNRGYPRGNHPPPEPRPGHQQGQTASELSKSQPTRNIITPAPKPDPEPDPWWALALKLLSEFIE